MLTEEMAAICLEEGGFLQPPEEAAFLFSELFPKSGQVVSTAGSILHISGLKETAHLFLEDRLELTDDPGLVKLSLATICEVDGDPHRGLELIEQVPETIPRFHVIKGNLLKSVD